MDELVVLENHWKTNVPVPPVAATDNGVKIVPPTHRFCVAIGGVLMESNGVMTIVAVLVLMVEQPPLGNVIMQ